MPKGTVQERSFELIPKGWYSAKLISVTERQAGKGVILNWKWEIVEGEYAGRNVWGECWNFLDQGDGCVWRRWHEALVEREVDIGENIDTDDVVNLMAQIYVEHEDYWSDKYGENRTKFLVPMDPEAVASITADVTQSPREPQAVMAGSGDDPWATPSAEGPPF